MVAHSFDRFYVVTKFILPAMNDLKLSPINYDGECRYLVNLDDNKNKEIKTCIKDFVEAWYSLEQYIGLKEDKLSSTTVDFIRSEGNLETKCLYWFSKPKMC